MKCPSCPDAGMMTLDRNGVQIDYCPTCRGVWLDRGELEKIIDHSQSGASADPASDISDEPDKRRRNLITELFDF